VVVDAAERMLRFKAAQKGFGLAVTWTLRFVFPSTRLDFQLLHVQVDFQICTSGASIDNVVEFRGLSELSIETGLFLISSGGLLKTQVVRFQYFQPLEAWCFVHTLFYLLLCLVTSSFPA